jgi:hypothetical protein
MTLTKKGYSGLPGCGFGVGLTTPHSKKLIVTKVEQRNKLDRSNGEKRKRTRYAEITLATCNIQNMLLSYLLHGAESFLRS